LEGENALMLSGRKISFSQYLSLLAFIALGALIGLALSKQYFSHKNINKIRIDSNWIYSQNPSVSTYYRKTFTINSRVWKPGF